MIVYRNIKKNELDLWFEICEKNFGNVSKKYFSDPYYEEEKTNLKDIIVALEDDKIIGGIRVVYRQVKMNNEIVVVGGLTDINVVARSYFYIFIELLKKAFKYLKEQGINYVLGYTTINARHIYQKLHTFELEKKYDVFEMQKTEQNICERAEIRRFCDQDLEQLIEIYNKRKVQEESYIIRTSAYWNKFIAPKLKYACIYKKDNVILGYIVCNGLLRDENSSWYWNIGEYYAVEESDILGDLVHAMIKEFHLPNCVRIPSTINIAGARRKNGIYDKRMKLWYLGEESNLNINIIEGIQKAFFWGMDQF